VQKALPRWSQVETAGSEGNPAGRVRGSRNKLSEEVICALLRDFRLHGEKAVAKVRRLQPAAYLKICALLVPKEMKLEHSGGIKAMSDEQLEAAFELLQGMVDQRLGGRRPRWSRRSGRGSASRG
jgi:hypothetical protein